MPFSSLTARLHGAGAARPGRRATWTARRPGRRTALLAGAALLLLVAVYAGLRLSPLSAVQRVSVVGLQGPNAPDLRRAIQRAAVGQSTLGFDEGAVRRVLAGTASVTGVTVHTNFPHGVQVEVDQRVAVGAVERGGRRVSVAADGTLLPDWTVGTLPVIAGARADDGAVVGGARRAVRILGAAPAALLATVARVDDATVVRLADGPALLFRDTTRVHAKWAAAAAVLSDPKTAGATWIDLRIPEQPVAGSGAPPTIPPKGAKAGAVGDATDALATAEGGTATTGAGGAGSSAAPAAAATPATGGSAATGAAPAAATPRTAAPAATSAAPAAGASAASPPAAPAGADAPVTPNATAGAPASGGATTSVPQGASTPAPAGAAPGAATSTSTTGGTP
ncbi:FtsQ-type POTRA domain-containing protein [Patulibacter sp. SYSU D01012]|uniref:cell division protein FtsQ/DivIB n=1 Tax=Patulibacter sp. SYSU D01012 TaxID=2817381 RepID=UPI001B30DEBE|nr:FtsQ-type POTRA domain-containing protein [Patulibacter sp. SYSU D01012]